MLRTIGMAVYDDPRGVEFTIESTALHQDVDDVEFLVVDNHPGTENSERVKNLLAAYPNSQYIELASPRGTAPPRNKVFEMAKGDYVVCVDSHIVLGKDALRCLWEYYDRNPNTKDLIGGPMLHTGGGKKGFHTQFDEVWRGAMWGTWGNAWKCNCIGIRPEEERVVFSVRADRDGADGLCTYWAVEAPNGIEGARSLTQCLACGRRLPKNLKFYSHQDYLRANAYYELGTNPMDPPFEVPGQGLGLFSCRKDAWLGFNEHFIEFGGEELYIHNKFANAGRKVLCLPGLRWWHSFTKPERKEHYPLGLYTKARNYVLGFTELEFGLHPVWDHFVNLDTRDEPLALHLVQVHAAKPEDTMGKSPEQLVEMHKGYKLTEAEWAYLTADPVAHVKQPARTVTLTLAGAAAMAQPSFGRPQPPAGASLQGIYDWCRGVPRDLDQHLHTLRDLAERFPRITEFSKRREAMVGFLAGHPAKLISYQTEQDELYVALHRAVQEYNKTSGKTPIEFTVRFGPDVLEVDPIEETDVLWIDSIHSEKRLTAELAKHGEQVKRAIVFRGTGHAGLVAEATKDDPGLFYAIKMWLDKHPGWFVSYHTNTQFGLTIITNDETLRPELPIVPWPKGYGPGTEMKKIYKGMGIEMPEGCDCRGKMLKMDEWGAEGCIANRATIIQWMRDGQDKWGWTDKVSAGVRTVVSGLVFKINPFDPFPGLVDEAIRRGAEVEKQMETRSHG